MHVLLIMMMTVCSVMYVMLQHAHSSPTPTCPPPQVKTLFCVYYSSDGSPVMSVCIVVQACVCVHACKGACMHTPLYVLYNICQSKFGKLLNIQVIKQNQTSVLVMIISVCLFIPLLLCC